MEMKLLMGLFSKGKQSCDICGKTIGFGKVKCLDGVICGDCQLKQHKVSKIIGSNKLTLDEIKSYICSGDENVRKLNEFVVTRKVGKFLEIDENKQQWLIPDGPLGSKKNPKIYNFSDISSYELIEDNDTIIRDCFGSFNAKVAKKNVSKLYVKITVKDFNNPVVMIKIVNTPIKKNSLAYSSAFKSAQEIMSLLELINTECNDVDKVEKASGTVIYCKKCGNKMDIDSVFCSKCGEKL
ncbi:TPA: zinc-ribbon domain-containing protein [Clostridium perfringens]|uniref:Zinc-ribbon domain-containing protein n=1 Tax=Clostridium perfringens TaxID=1502 RepID=A0A8H9R052_CLOPF|nr:zinc-ribbon domain-containing protein [Clostridium perfringens]